MLKIRLFQTFIYLVLCGITDESLGVSKCHIGRGGSVALVVGDDFNLAVLEHAYAGVGRAQVNANCRSHCVLEGEKDW